MKEIIKQNELEFFFEGHRFFDLKRWYTPTEMKQVFVDNKKQGANNFQPKHYYLPIPEGEINTNTKIQQHPLWR
ncbi:SusD family protein [compost metagenome]